MKKKTFIIMLILGIVFVTACQKKTEGQDNDPNAEKPREETIANTNADVIKEQIIDGLKIDNISVVITKEHTDFTADVTNTNIESVYVKSFDIVFKDELGNEITRMLGFVGTTLEPNASKAITAGIEMDLSNVKSVEYIRNY